MSDDSTRPAHWLNIPNLITVSRLLMAVVLVAVIEADGWWKTATVLFLIAAATDFLAEVVQDWEASTDLVDDNQHKSQEDGRESYEKVDELQALDDSPTPEVTRQVTEALSVPLRTESLLPQVPLRQV